MSKISSLAAILPILAMGYMDTSKPSQPFDMEEEKRRIKATEENYQPKDTNLYCFNTEGSMVRGQMLKSECVFNCYARNEKNARRKYNNYLKSLKI